MELVARIGRAPLTRLRAAEVSAAEETNCSVAPVNWTERFIDELTSLMVFGRD